MLAMRQAAAMPALERQLVMPLARPVRELSMDPSADGPAHKNNPVEDIWYIPSML